MKIASMTSWSPLLRGSNFLLMGASCRWRQLAAGLCSLALAGGLFASEPPVTISILENPVSKVLLTDETSFLAVDAEVSGDDTLEYQWFKNGVLIPGATSATLPLNSVTADAAGRYSCLVQAVIAEVERFSDVALVVVANPVIETEARVLSEGGNLRLGIPPPASPARSNITYGWELQLNDEQSVDVVDQPANPEGRSIRGATTRSLAISKLVPNDAGTYVCSIYAGDTSREVGFFPVQVRPRPVIDEDFGPFTWRVGETLEPAIQMALINGEDLPAGTLTYKASRLPAGVRMSEGGLISGRPLRTAPEKSLFTVVATLTGEGFSLKSAPVSFTYTVAPVTPGLDGTYHGLVLLDEIHAPKGGAIRVTVTKTGAFSGVLVRGANSTPIKGMLETDSNGGFAANTGVEDFTFAIDLTGEFFGAPLIGTFFTPETRAPDVMPSVVGFRQINPAVTLAGQYNVAMQNSSPIEGEPLGASYYTLKVAASSGVVRGAGRLADGTVITFASAACTANFVTTSVLEAIVPLYTSLYAGGGYLQSALLLSSEGSFQSMQAQWVRPEISGNLYPAGFAVELNAIGVKYSPPAPGEIIFGLRPEANNARIQFSSEALVESIMQSLTVAAPASTTVNLPLAGNLGKLVINQINPATGLFSGSVTFSDTVGDGEAAVTTSRKAKFQGILMPGYNFGVGYFLLNPLGGSEQLSGQVFLSNGILDG